MTPRKAAPLDLRIIEDEGRDELPGRALTTQAPTPDIAKLQARGRRSRRKGGNFERSLVRRLQDEGWAAEKLSRMYRAGPDLSWPLLGIGRSVECKVRARGLETQYRWLDGADLVVAKQNRREELVTLRLRLFLEIASAAEKSRAT